jgi:hypothetical protein
VFHDLVHELDMRRVLGGGGGEGQVSSTVQHLLLK